ncbi:MAG: hypothetical protein KatS3mg120_1942 [Erythrobacter sp.]|nr:MAG: hypothetical protein KatS3mg120_1942 [Erythrobacter sp.]
MTSSEIPEGFSLVRRIGPFDAASLPAGLLSSHSLKAGRWGWVQITEGAVRMVWEDEPLRSEELVAPTSVLIPPETVHHLEVAGPFKLQIAFLERESAD